MRLNDDRHGGAGAALPLSIVSEAPCCAALGHHHAVRRPACCVHRPPAAQGLDDLKRLRASAGGAVAALTQGIVAAGQNCAVRANYDDMSPAGTYGYDFLSFQPWNRA